jgi:endonuclease/exonuclease/phosphatase family metal-dependent hydrolase
MDGEVSAHAILLGDFNCTPAAPEYELLVGPMSPYGGRVTHPLGFVDAWLHAGGDPEAGFTSEVEGEPARLDYAFISAGLRNRIEKCWVDVVAVGSDHQPVWLELSG